MDFASTEGAYISAPKGKNACEYAFYPGCQLGASNPDYVLKSYEFLKNDLTQVFFLGCLTARPHTGREDEKRLREHY